MKKFTLIELLIVVAVIGILLSLLMPALSKARGAARLAVCLSNQGQIIRAAFIFSKKNNSLFPPKSSPGWEGWLGSQGTGGGNTKPSKRPLNPLLQPKSDYEKVLVSDCPEDDTIIDIQGTSYMGNVATQGWIRPYNLKNDTYLMDIVSPSRFAMAFEQNVMVYNNAGKYYYLHKERKMNWVFGFADGAVTLTKVERKVLSTDSYTLDINDGK